MRAWAARNEIDEATLLGVLVSGPSNVSEIEDTRQLLGLTGDRNTAWRFDCNGEFPDGFSGASIQRVLCYRDASDHLTLRVDMPSLYLTRALNTARLADIMPWGLVMAQAGDIYPIENGSVAGSADELSAMADSGRGEAIIHTLVDLSTVSIAYEQRLYGGILALAIVDDIVDGAPLTSDHRLALQSNPYLADNVGVLLLRRWTGRPDIASWDEQIPFLDTYLTSVLHARNKLVADRLDLLVPLFGEFENASLVVDPLKEELTSIRRPLDEEVPSWIRLDDKAAIRFETDSGPAFIPMLAPYQLVEGRLVMPPAYDRLIDVRQRLVDREMSYVMGRDEYIDVLLASLQKP